MDPQRFTPGIYRRPLVQAVQLDDSTPWGAVADWCHGVFRGAEGDIRTYCIVVSGGAALTVVARAGDWIVLDRGRYQVMSDDLFHETFTYVEPRTALDDDLASILGPRYSVPRQPTR